MPHIGHELKKAIIEGGFKQAQVAERMKRGKNTIQRWISSPNLGLREVREVQQAIPELYLKNVFDALEQTLGHEIPDNPYRDPDRPSQNPQDAAEGIQLLLDARKFAGYRIPEDIIDRVVTLIEDAQDEEYIREKRRQKEKGKG